VRQSIVRITGEGLKVVVPKTAKSQRLVTLPSSVVALLSALKATQKDVLESLGIPWNECRFVLSHADGIPFHPDTVTHSFARIRREAGLPHVRLHDLRHSHASLMLAAGVHPKIVSERLGHSSVMITMDVYSHVLPGLQEAAAEAFERLMSMEEQYSR